jgi:hypothetical protein
VAKKRKKKSQNNKKEICNDKYKHTRDRLFGLHWQKKNKKKCQNNIKEIYNDKYKHTRDRLFGLGYKAIGRYNRDTILLVSNFRYMP